MEFLEIPPGVDIIEIRKQMNKMLFEAKKIAKPTKCILCGRQQTSFCNSHSVPQLVVRPIAQKGMVLHASAALGFNEELVDLEAGVNKSGTFNFICRNCDNSFFQDYENESNLLNRPTDKMLAEIAVKDMLLLMSKRAVEKELAKIHQKRSGLYENVEDLLAIKDLDENEFKEEIFFHKGIVDRNETGGYQILFWKLLPYVIPIAAQSAIALSTDMNGEIINDVYDYNPDVRMQYMHLCFFPLKEKSIVLAFYHKRDRLYRNLKHQVNASQQEDILKYLNYLLFAHTENYFISKTIQREIETNMRLRKLSQETNGFPEMGYLNENNNFGMGYVPVDMNEIPNFLLRDWAIALEINEK